MGIFGRLWKKRKHEETPSPQREDRFSEKAVADLEKQGCTIRWRYGYKLANRYEVKQVCAGGMGVVYIVEDLMEEGKRYAAKTLKAYFRMPKTEQEWAGWEKSVNDYIRECNIWVDLGKHRHIVQAEYLEKIEGVPLVMSEFIDGGDLNDLLKKGPLEIATALNFGIQFCIGMEYANRKGMVVHRDIKPGNILITRDGIVKVNDFGIAKAINSAEAIKPMVKSYEALGSESLLVSRGMGTPPYMAPEQFPESLLEFFDYPLAPLSVETDIYAFGLVLYEMIIGFPVVQIASLQEEEIQRLASQIASKFNVRLEYAYCFLKTFKVTPPSPSVNEHLNAVIFKCLEKDPSRRYHGFDALREELFQIYREETGSEFPLIDEPAYEPSWRNRGKTYWVLGREKEAFEFYDRAVEKNPADTLAWVEKGLALAELGDLAEFMLCMEMASYIEPSKEAQVQQYKTQILDDDRVHPRDVRFVERLSHQYNVSERLQNWVLESAGEFADPFRETNPTIMKLIATLEDVKKFKPPKRKQVTKFASTLDVSEEETLEETALALGELGDRSAVPVLLEALDCEDIMVAEAAARALGKLGDRSIVPVLVKRLESWDVIKRLKAADLLGELGDRSVVPSLRNALNRENVALAKDYFAMALCKLGDSSAVPILMKALKHKDDYFRWRAAEALGELGDKSAVPALIETLRDENDVVRMEAREALAKIGDKSVIPALLETLKSREAHARVDALKGLELLGDGSVVPELIEALKDEDFEVRWKVASILGKLGDASAVSALIEALEKALLSEDIVVGDVAAKALGELGDKSAVPALIEALKYGYVQKGAAEALGRLGDKRAVPALVEALKSDDWGMRNVVAIALGELGDRSTVPAVLEAMVDEEILPDPHVMFRGLRRLCSHPDSAKLSEVKDKFKAWSALEWNKKGSTLVAQEEYITALECFEKAVEIDPVWEVPKKARDECLKNVDKGVVQPAIVELEGTVPASIETQKVKSECVDWLRKGTALFNFGRYAEAMECYDKAVEMDSGSSDAWYCKGITLNRLSKHEEAVVSFDRAVKINPRDKLSWYNMGYALTKLGRHEEAKQCFDRVLEVDPIDADAWYSKGHNLAMLGRYLEAMQCYDKTLTISPRYAYAWAGKGVILHQLGKRKEAMNCFRKALEIDPNLRENLGHLLTEE